MRNRTTQAVVALTLALVASMYVTASGSQNVVPAVRTASIERGAYLVTTMGCHDCHTPLKFGPNGPEPDMSRALTGHPSEAVLPPAPKLVPGPWMMVGAGTGTAFAGPWGVSFTANLTPDKDTGLGEWTFEMFRATMKTGRHQGKGRRIMPPMPYQNVGALTDADMRDLFTYLQSLPPVHNKVPSPIDPPEEAR